MKNGQETNYKYPPSSCGITDKLIKKYQVQSDHWFLLFKGVPEETRDKPYLKQKEIVEEKGYEVPSLMGAVVSILTHNQETGEFVFSDGSNGNRWTYTRVEEIGQYSNKIIIGGFSPAGLSVSAVNLYDYDDIGVAFQVIGHWILPFGFWS